MNGRHEETGEVTRYGEIYSDIWRCLMTAIYQDILRYMEIFSGIWRYTTH